LKGKYLEEYMVLNKKTGEWKSRTNRELEEMSKGENIVKWIKGQRISWLGQLEKMEEDRMPKNTFTQELEGTRRRGRPRKRWKEEVERDFQVLGVRRWRELVADRKKMEGHCSTGQSPQWAVVAKEEEEVSLLQSMPQRQHIVFSLSRSS
jgi:hypothetical protein